MKEVTKEGLEGFEESVVDYLYDYLEGYHGGDDLTMVVDAAAEEPLNELGITEEDMEDLRDKQNQTPEEEELIDYTSGMAGWIKAMIRFLEERGYIITKKE